VIISTSMSGLGDVTKTQLAQAGITTGVSSTAAILMATGAVTGPVGLAIAGAAVLAGYIAQAFSGCGATCTQATAIVNQIEPYLKQNVSNYLALATPRPKSAQAAALNVFNSAWSNVLAACSNASLGDAGVRCISDRNRGGKWDWFSYYYDPIANDSSVYDDSVGTSVLSASSNIATNLVSTVTNSFSGHSWLLPALLAGVGIIFVFGGKRE